MKKTIPFRTRNTDKKLKVEAFNRKKFVKDFIRIVKNDNLDDDQTAELLYNLCLYNKNSPLKNKKGLS